MGHDDRVSQAVQLVEVDATNWRPLVALGVRPDQAEFVMPIAHYLCLCQFGGVWNPRAIVAGGVVLGHVMWAYDDDEGATWLGGLVIGEAMQGQGYGRAAVEAFIDEFTAEDGSVHVALSYHPSNVIARELYLGIGFEETGEMEDGEVVARLARHDDDSGRKHRSASR